MNQQNLHQLKEYAPTILIMVAVISIGLFGINQFMGWAYKIQFLGTPCELCSKTNPSVEKCFEESSRTYNPYWDNLTKILLEDTGKDNVDLYINIDDIGKSNATIYERNKTTKEFIPIIINAG